MKTEEKKLARKLRKQGLSLREIKQKLKVAKSSISVWVRDIELTKKQKQGLSENGIKKEVIERRRTTRITRENIRRAIIVDKAKTEIKNLSQKELWLIGIALYWGEGAKTIRSGVQFSNSDPRAIQLMIQFFKKCCEVPEKKFRGRVFLHPHLSISQAKKYWHQISDIPLSQFHKTATSQSKTSKNKKDNLPFGTFNIQICNTELFLKIKGWIEKLHELTTINKNMPR